MGIFDWLSKKPGEDGTPEEASADEADSAVVGPQVNLEQGAERYEDEGQIAKGGMGVVRRVFNRNLLRSEAMKVLDPKFAEDQNELLRFLEEAQITGQLDHPNIPAVHEIGNDGKNTHFFTMKMVRGQTLEQLLRAKEFTIADDEQLFQVLQILIKVCDAIAFAHSRGVIHCDLKPPNVMIGRFGQVFVMDWGIARLKGVKRKGRTETGVDMIRTMGRDHAKDEGRVLGTLGYMAPEQARGEVDALDERTDVFALGALLYRVLTGRAPHVGPTMEETWEVAKRCEVADPQEVAAASGLTFRPPPALCRIAMKALRADPTTRHASVAEFQAKLDEFMRGAGRYPTKTYAEGESIIRQGEKGEQAFVILKGQVRVWRDDHGTARTIRNLGPGEVFGETAILTDQMRSANVDALEPLTVVVIARDALERELGHTFWVGHILRAVAERFRDLDSRLQAQLRSVEPAMQSATLRFFAFNGQPRDGARVVNWTALRRHLKHSLKLGDMEVMALCAGIQGLRVDGSADEALLMPEPAPATSRPAGGTLGTVRTPGRTPAPVPRPGTLPTEEQPAAERSNDDPTLPPGTPAVVLPEDSAAKGGEGAGAAVVPAPAAAADLSPQAAPVPEASPFQPAVAPAPPQPGDSPFQPVPAPLPLSEPAPLPLTQPAPLPLTQPVGESPIAAGPALPASPFEPLGRAPASVRPRSGALSAVQPGRSLPRPPSGALPSVGRGPAAPGREVARPGSPRGTPAISPPPQTATVLDQPAVILPTEGETKGKGPG